MIARNAWAWAAMKQLHFVVSLPSSNGYQREQAAGAREAARQLGASVQVVHSDSDAVKQSQQILEVIQSRSTPRPDAILFEPLTSTGLVRAGEAAVAAGIGWVVLNADVDYLERLRSQTTAPVFAVTRDHTEIGRIQGRQFEALLPAGGSILYIQGPATSSAATQRTIGLESTKPANLKMKTLRSQWSESDAYRTVSAWLRLATSRASTIDLVGCQYDGITMGARKAFEEHLDAEERKHWLRLPFTGVDGLPSEGQAWVNQGILAATVVAPTTTQVAIQMLVRALENGIKPPERTLIELKSYPSLEELSAKAAQYARK
jgi:ribose transport system substrate-binding protein